MPTVTSLVLDDEAGCRPRATRAGGPERRLEQHRPELTAFCRRMLGSADAEDAVQETLVRAWRGFDHFEGRAALRTWLHRIAYNVCLDSLRARQRRARRMELAAPDRARGPAPGRGQAMGVAAMDTDPVDAALGNPAEEAVGREALGLALAALMRLPPRQRAVLILRDVLRWRAVEVAELLEMSVASVNSALQRARSTLADREPPPADASAPHDEPRRQLLARYVRAFERYDLEVLNTIVREDAQRARGSRQRRR